MNNSSARKKYTAQS